MIFQNCICDTKVSRFINKGIELTIQQEVIMEDKKDLKRVNVETKIKTKEKNNKSNKKEVEVPKNQQRLNSFFAKK